MSYLDDPRVYFAAERTLLAWQRSAIALMGLGFVIERFGLFIQLMAQGHAVSQSQTTLSLYIGVGFILIGACTPYCPPYSSWCFINRSAPRKNRADMSTGCRLRSTCSWRCQR